MTCISRAIAKTGSYDVFCAKSVRENTEHKEAEDLGPAINGEGIATFADTIAPDQNYLLLGSFTQQPGMAADTLVSFYAGGVWGKPINLDPKSRSQVLIPSSTVPRGTERGGTSQAHGFLGEKRVNPLHFNHLRKSQRSSRRVWVTFTAYRCCRPSSARGSKRRIWKTGMNGKAGIGPNPETTGSFPLLGVESDLTDPIVFLILHCLSGVLCRSWWGDRESGLVVGRNIFSPGT